MTSERTSLTQLHYKNPVYPFSFPDPYVLKHNGEFFAYCTGHWSDGLVFGVLQSHDLIEWSPVGGAMTPLDNSAPFYWAPEITYDNGTFYLYYSVGNETLMHLRVAVSDRPDGGFEDTGHQLTFQDFAIDAHVFQDDDGSKYLFYATDFLDHSHIGTGIVVDRMIDWYTLAGEPRPVARAKYDWQVYDPARKEKGGVRWHTVEGPFVLKRKGTYFMMFSGGNWQNPTYGVSYATSDRILKDGEWDQYCDGEKLLPILRTYPEKLIGPGHNSVVRGPDNRELYCVYHAWVNDQRVLAVNRMEIVGGQMMIEESPFLEKPRPNLPERFVPGETIASLPASFLLEAGFIISASADGARFGLRFAAGQEMIAELVLTAVEGILSCEWRSGDSSGGDPAPIQQGLATGALHMLRLERDNCLLRLAVNGREVSISHWLPGAADSLTFLGDSSVLWTQCEMTPGFENLFIAGEGSSLDKLGWHSSDPASVMFGDGELRLAADGDAEVDLWKAGAHPRFQLSAAVRLAGTLGENTRFGFFAADQNGGVLVRMYVTAENGRFYITDDSHSVFFELPLDYQPGDLHRFGFVWNSFDLQIDLDMLHVGSIPIAVKEVCIGFCCYHSEIAVESVRSTVLTGIRAAVPVD